MFLQTPTVGQNLTRSASARNLTAVFDRNCNVRQQTFHCCFYHIHSVVSAGMCMIPWPKRLQLLLLVLGLTIATPSCTILLSRSVNIFNIARDVTGSQGMLLGRRGCYTTTHYMQHTKSESFNKISLNSIHWRRLLPKCSALIPRSVGLIVRVRPGVKCTVGVLRVWTRTNRLASECDEQFHPSALASSTVRAGVVHSPRLRRPQSALACTLPWCNFQFEQMLVPTDVCFVGTQLASTSRETRVLHIWNVFLSSSESGSRVQFSLKWLP